MKFRILLILLFVLFAASFVSADIGPSPSYSFSISNDIEYPGYEFLYAGNIWPDKLEPVTEETNVYKLNTHITVYAIPRGQALEISNAIASQEIDLKSGHTIFKVMSLNEETKQMDLKTQEQIPDTVPSDPLTDYLLMFGALAVVLIIIIIFVVKAKK
ncbi:MAG: hypothetical protein ABIH20_00480 [Candidatus Diapherotrites archaeon]